MSVTPDLITPLLSDVHVTSITVWGSSTWSCGCELVEVLHIGNMDKVDFEAYETQNVYDSMDQENGPPLEEKVTSF